MSVMLTPNQAEAITAMFPKNTVAVRSVSWFKPGAIHVEPVGEHIRAALITADCSRKGGCLGITWKALNELPRGAASGDTEE